MTKYLEDAVMQQSIVSIIATNIKTPTVTLPQEM